MPSPSIGARANELPPHDWAAFALLSTSKSLKPIVEKIPRIAQTNLPILIIGESGTGKELVAQAIHEQSLRINRPFVCLNLGAIPQDLAESVLFGHEKGAFTGATTSSVGYCRNAQGGTLFLDEIGEADLPLQVKLLRFLENHEIQPLGAAQAVRVDVRIITATNRNLELAIRDKQFREDLYYRINVLQIKLPSLRERAGDIDQLIDHFLEIFNWKYGRQCQIADAVRVRLCNAYWPGNIRQLRSGIENLVVLADHDLIAMSDLTSEFLTRIGSQCKVASHEPCVGDVKELDRLTHQLVEDVMRQEHGHVNAAVQRLGVSRATLYRWLKKYRQTPATFEASAFDESLDDTAQMLSLLPGTVLASDIRW